MAEEKVNSVSQPQLKEAGEFSEALVGFRPPKILISLVGLLLILLLFFLGIKILKRPKKPVEEGKFPLKQIVAQAGKETLYGRDLNYELKVYFPDAYKSSAPVSEEIIKKALDQIVTDSLLLQAAADEGLITLNGNVFNNPDKIFHERNILIESIEERVNAKFVNWVKGELISIWFKNIYEPKMGLEAARAVTRAKMEAIYNDLTLVNLTSLKEAGEVIRNDPSLALIDPSYKGNAYVTFEVKQGERYFIDPKIQTAAFNLTPGQLSPILVGQDKNPGTDFYDCSFIVIKIENRKLQGFESFEDWFNQKRQNYEVTLKI